ncbi:DUF2797 domain-containing protein [Streptosporangium sp. NBC_01755]|uniref:DUF2797 domain-containing protein n=1 Tax=unclassified Streptosporangium TaxID=2632669 RepID=UPI002DD84CCB|nr:MULTISPECIES: DUF2797 domain-containing protein [unclassified Streptosporangium]WSA26191.1 DUF2797 domain-containing protein [Streptosporangium sp. NBC_01810]WSD02379.1 DUF2797 domain-containing protein [Streptosporangium sp. NBC_01755]
MPVPLPEEGEYVCHGITWATGDPRLLLAPLPGGPLAYAEIMHQRLGFQVTGTGRWCTGRYRFADTVRVEALACPDRAPAEQSGQCTRCAGRDDFRSAHQFHQGSHAPEALVRYMDQPHWLYLATFADGTTKVGTAAEPRKRSRLDEQGALFATYLTKSPDGRAVRHLEDALTHRLQLPQTVRAAAKLQALVGLTDLSTPRAAHEQHVARASDTLADMSTPSVLEAWTPPAEGDRLRTASRERALYPHDLREGKHGFTPVSCVGSQVLAVLDHNDAMGYLLDLGALKGRRITLGPFSSPSAAIQTSLF